MMLYSTHTWELVQALDSASPASCKAPATTTDFISRNNHLPRNRKIVNKDQTPKKIVSYYLGLHTQNPWLREVNRLTRRGKNTKENKSYCTEFPNSMLFNISKSTSKKLPIESIFMTGVYSGIVTPKDKTK